MDAKDPIGSMSFEEKVRLMLRRRGMTQEMLAEALGTSRNSVSNWMTKGHDPQLGTAVRLARALGVSLDWLTSDEVYD
jgi:transcriptional regulator with XRE-family HTH domain